MATEFDAELNELLSQNQKSLAQMHSEFKEVSKIMEEPFVNIRKVKKVKKLNKPAGSAVVADQEEEAIWPIQ